MISNGISSALIFEDDADFSVGIRDIMEGLSKQLQKATGAKNGEPYGIVDNNSWDMLTLGHCGYMLPDPEKNPKAANKIRVWVDPYAPESSKVASYLPNAPSKHLRLLSPSKGSVCNQGYAITREGAMRLLYNIGGPGHVLNQAKDLLILEQLNRGKLKGFLSVPDIVAQWKLQDWRDTDIQLHSEKQLKWFKKGTGRDIVGSVREEIESIYGNRDVWEEIENEEDEDEDEEDEEMDIFGNEVVMEGAGKVAVIKEEEVTDEEHIKKGNELREQVAMIEDEQGMTEEEEMRKTVEEVMMGDEERMTEEDQMRKAEEMMEAEERSRSLPLGKY